MKPIKGIKGRWKWLIFFGIAFLITQQSCTDAIRHSFDSVPTAFGQSSEIVVIADNDEWEGALGDSIKYYFGGAYPILPQPEPMFDLRHFSPQELTADPLRKELRVYMIVGDLSDENSATTKLIRKDLGEEKMRRAMEDPTYISTVGRERWASGQLIVYIFGQTMEQTKQNVVKSFNAVAKRVTEHDFNQLDANVFLDGENRDIISKIKEKFNFNIRIPSEYQIARSGNGFLWIRKDTRETVTSIMISELPYRNENQFSKENIVALQDSLGARYISGTELGSYMKTDSINLPVFVYNKKIDGQYGVEARGIWALENDFMGGPFSAYLILDKANNRILFLDGFVYAPTKRKRQYIQAVEHIAGTVRFD